ncbi:uncharacterized protein LOC141640999 [Silene latifolia]|uniref:uncharacterized protein LOC141640999 n=1 Tax=Silene latifolia TaxID=37657 RepID=UPI003D76FA06
MGILETRIKHNKFSNIAEYGFSRFVVLTNNGSHPNGRIWVIWRKNLGYDIIVVDISSQWIHLLIKIEGKQYYVTMVYASNSATTRHVLWEFSIKQNIQEAWILMGDFNCVRTMEEMISNSRPDYQDMADFNDGIKQAKLDDLASTRCCFTWTNKQEEWDRKWMKLDRALVNGERVLRFPSSCAAAFEPGVSDHSPICVTADCNEKYIPKSFKFLNCWAQHPTFHQLVAAKWEWSTNGNCMESVLQCQRTLKKDLKQLHRANYSGITDRVLLLWEQLKTCQQQFQTDPLNGNLLQQEKVLCDSYCKFRNIELQIAYQRAKTHEIKMGDASTSYFFAKVALRRNTNAISGI